MSLLVPSSRHRHTTDPNNNNNTNNNIDTNTNNLNNSDNDEDENDTAAQKYREKIVLAGIAKKMMLVCLVLVCLDLILRATRGVFLPNEQNVGGSVVKLWEIHSPLVVKDDVGDLVNDAVAVNFGGSENVDELCGGVNLFLDHKKNHIRANTKPPIISIIYVTKRPGGYDMLLNSLAQQIYSTNTPVAEIYELICVDELAAYRSQRIYQLARELSLPPSLLVVPSKPKSKNFQTTHYNLYNAINTGLLLARGSVVVFVTDFVWLPDIFVQHVVDFYSVREHAKSLLGFPDQVYQLRDKDFLAPQDFPNNQISLFHTNITRPLHQISAKFEPSHVTPRDFNKLKQNKPQESEGEGVGVRKQPLSEFGAKVWDTAMAAPFSCLEQLNGAEEQFDAGNDGHDTNIRMRCELLGYDIYFDGDVMLQSLYHKNHAQFGDRGTWSTNPKDTVEHLVIVDEMAEIARGERGIASQGHQFNLAKWRKWDCAARL